MRDNAIIGNMINRVFEYIKTEKMMEDTETVVAGVSGGADSVCLLYLLKEYAKLHPVKLIAAHVHHGLRQNADLDEEYVKEICEKWDIPLKVCHIDAAREAKELGMSVEEAGRKKRYEFFESVLKEGGGSGKIAVAHHRDDLCETILFQLFRGSGISGMRGILPVSGNVIRPLLCVARSDIEEYLTALQISWREDESNTEDIYARNRIRHEILPVAEEICTGAGKHMAAAAERLREIEDLVNSEVEKARPECLRAEENGGITILNQAMKLHPAVYGELILSVLGEVAGKKKDIGQVQVDAVKELYASETGKQREFIYALTAKRTYDGVCIQKGSAPKPERQNAGESVELILDEGFIEASVPGFPGNKTVNIHFPEDPDIKNLPMGPYRKWFDYDVIKGKISLRLPEADDYLIINSEGRKKPLSEYFKDSKIPKEERPYKWILAKDSLVLWVIGHRMGEYGKVSGSTERIVEIEIVPNE